ncbi:MAG: T9SS type A sorting domain-containing protein [Dysgonomonas sp.]
MRKKTLLTLVGIMLLNLVYSQSKTDIYLTKDLVYNKASGKNLFEVEVDEAFTISVHASSMANVSLGLYLNGILIEDIVKGKIGTNVFECTISDNVSMGNYIIQPYLKKADNTQIISREKGSYVVDRLPIYVTVNWDDPWNTKTASTKSVQIPTTSVNNFLINTGTNNLLEVIAGNQFKVLIQHTNASTNLKIGLFNTNNGTLICDLIQSVKGNTYTCVVPLTIRKGRYTIMPYEVVNDWLTYVERSTNKPFLADRLPLYVVNENVINAPDELSLSYSEDLGNTILAEYNAVRVGEYYWMDTPFKDNVALTEPGWSEPFTSIRFWRQSYRGSMTPENINLLHHRLLMFENARLENERESYFDQFSPGLSLEEKMKEFEQNYGTYLTRGHIEWMNIARNYVIAFLEGDNKVKNMNWDLPTPESVRQLLAMCGNATTAEVRQYLSYGSDQEDAPNIARITPQTYFDWFYHNPVNFRGESNSFNVTNTNKYGFKMFPTGSKFNDPTEYRPLTWEDGYTYVTSKGEQYPYQAKRGDFIGLNQIFSMALGSAQSFILHDYPEIRSEKSYHWTPIRWCRSLTEEELGYKLYINDLDFTDSRASLVLLKNKLDNGENVIIEKKKLTEAPSKGFKELPKGYLRGFYVQYILNQAKPQKTIQEIVDIALQNIYVWGGVTKNTPNLLNNRNVVDSDIKSEIRVYPNPVVDVLNIEGVDVQEIIVLGLNGRQISKVLNTNSISMQNLNSGIYLVKIKTSDREITYKVIKK